MRYSTAALFAVVIAVAAACDNQPATPPAALPPVAEAATETTVSESDLAPVNPEDPQTKAAAFRAAWGQGSPVQYRPAKPDEEVQTYSASKLIPIGTNLYALITDGQGGEAHASAGSLAIHYLKRTADGFARVGAWPAFLYSGSWGSAPKWDIRHDLMTAPTLVATAGGTWQGYTCGWAHVIELTPQRPIKRIDQLPLSYSDGGARDEDEATHVEGRILSGDKGRTLRVRYTGDMTATVTYAKVGEVYDAVDMPEIPTC